MEGKSRFMRTVLALFTAFALVCGTWYLARTSDPAPYRVSSVRRPTAEENTVPERSEQEPSRPDSLLPGEVIDVERNGHWTSSPGGRSTAPFRRWTS